MFTDTIRTTALTGDLADSLFPHITGQSYMNDTSMVATLRALLGERISRRDGANKISVYFRSCQRVHDWSVEPESAVWEITGSELMPDTLYINSIAVFNDEQRKKELDGISEHFVRTFPDFRLLPRITEFYSKSFFVVCYINPETRTTVLIVDRLNLAKLHYLESATLAFLPWYFSSEERCGEDEIRLIRSLGMKESGEYLAAVAKIAEKYDFREMRIRALLPGFESRFERMEIERVQNQIQEINESIDRLFRQFRDKNRERDELNVRYLGLTCKADAEDAKGSEIMEFFLANKRLDLVSVSDRNLKFLITGYLYFWDKDEAQRCIDNPRSFLYRNSSLPDEDMKLLMEEIFVRESVKLRFCGGWDLELSGRGYPLTEYSYGPGYETYMPNPHLDKYGCSGNYLGAVNQCLQHNDYIAAIGECQASVGSLNWSDYTVMDTFTSKIRSTRAPKCIELPDGKLVSPRQAITWAKKQQTES